MIIWAVVSAQSEQAIELFPTRDKAEEMLALILEDEPDWREVLRVEPLELVTGLRNSRPQVAPQTPWGQGRKYPVVSSLQTQQWRRGVGRVSPTLTGCGQPVRTPPHPHGTHLADLQTRRGLASRSPCGAGPRGLL
jgi:hypothetical protein